ncbi:T9SS type A sorting domain-containing protein [Aureispira anguillae]|nr:T9SS type A sorting domain-containing protein [Aureispira anguillae]
MRYANHQLSVLHFSDSPLTGAASSLRISSNTLEANQAQNGIVVSNHNNNAVNLIGVIQNNTITMKGASPERAGISVLNSRLLVECNSIEGNRQTLNAADVFGIVGATNATLGGQSIYQCNAVDRTNIGVYFEGFNNLQFRGNRFDRHETGLLLESNAVIGVQRTNLPNGNQELHGNRWTGNTTEDAQNFNLANLPASVFFIDLSIPNNVPNNFGPTGTLPPTWFTPQFGTNTFDCNTPQLICRAPLLASPFFSTISSNNISLLTARDSSLALGTFTTTAYTPNARYTGQRGLYRKLVGNPSLQQGIFSNFVTTCQTNCIGHSDNVSEQCKQAFSIIFTDSLVLDSLKKVCNYYLDTLSCLDSMLAVNYNINTANTRTNFTQQLITVSNQRQALLSNVNNQQQASLTPICNVNNSISTIVKHELFEQQVNDIYLNTVAKGILEYSNSQLSILRLIASDCPQEGGKAVHTARGMLSRIEDVNFLDFDCSSNLRSKPMEQSNENTNTIDIWEVILYPNPTDDKLTVESNQILEGETTIEIYNSLGQQVQILTIEEDIQSINIDASSLLDGVYIMRLKNGNNSKTKAFVVSK